MNNEPVLWIDPLHDLSVRYAAQCWGKDLPETWGIISRAIKSEDLSNPVPVPEFLLYVSPPPSDALHLGEVPKAEGGELDYTKDPFYHFYKQYEEIKMLENPKPKPKPKSHFWEYILFFALFLYVNDKLWGNTNLPEDGAIFPLLISFFLTLFAAVAFSAILSLIQSIVNRKSKIANPK